MSGGYEMYAGRSDEEALALMTNAEYGHLTAGGAGASLGPSFVHYAPRPAEGEIWVHLANTNPMLAVLEAEPRALLTVFGPSAFIPSHWSDSRHAVPTSYYSWARFEVEAALLKTPEEIMAVLQAMLERYQPEGGHPAMDTADPVWEKMVGAITGLRLSIRGMRSRFKYGQNRSAAVREGIVRQLRKRGGPQDESVAKVVLERMGDGAAEDRTGGDAIDAAINPRDAGR